MPTASMTESVAPAVGHLADDVADATAVLGQVHRLDSPCRGAGESLGYEVDGDHSRAFVLCDARCHVSDGPEAEDGHRSPVGNCRVFDRLPCGGQHIGEVHESRIRRALRHFDVRELCLRDAKVLGLTAGDLTVELGEAEQCCAHSLFANLGGLALGVQARIAHVAVPAGDLERNDHSVSDCQIPCLRADFLDDAHRLVAEDVTFVHEGTECFVQMQVRTADIGGRDLHDRVRRQFYPRIGNGVHADFPLALPGHCAHVVLPMERLRSSMSCTAHCLS